MITYENKSGWAKNNINIRYVSVWDKEAFKIPGQMRFYFPSIHPESLEFVIDACYEENTLRVATYPHNNKDSLPIAVEKMEESIVKLLQEARKQNPDREWFTIDIEETPVLIREQDFSVFIPRVKVGDEMFIVDTEEENVKFPIIYVYQANQRNGQYKDLFSIMALASDVLMGDSTGVTQDGTDFTYMLLNSWMKRSFDSFVPEITSLTLPRSGRKEILHLLKTDALEKLLERSGVDKVIMRDGKIVLLPDEEEKQEKKQEEKQPETADDVFGPVDKASVMQVILKDVKEKNQFNLSEGLSVGFNKVLTLVLGYDNKPIDIFVDIHGIIRKACIYEGMYHVLLKGNSEQDLVNLLDLFDGLEQDFLNICNSDEEFRTFTKKKNSKIH